jgi:hypothetical protein
VQTKMQARRSRLPPFTDKPRGLIGRSIRVFDPQIATQDPPVSALHSASHEKPIGLPDSRAVSLRIATNAVRERAESNALLPFITILSCGSARREHVAMSIRAGSRVRPEES